MLLGELPIQRYVTNTFDSLDQVNELVDVMHQGTCLRGVVKITPNDALEQDDIKVVKTQKTGGGVIK